MKPPKKSRKRKLSLTEFSRCRPTNATRKTHGSKHCLPSNVYSDISRKLTDASKTNASETSNVFKALGCEDGADHCLLDKAPINDDVKKELRKQYLRPKYPSAWEKDPDMWLDNFNIINVMKQYESAIPWFTFMGVFPIDFSAPDPYRKNEVKQCLYKELCDLNLKTEYSKGIRGIGMVFNLDPHFKGGSHWVGLYINIMNIAKPFIGYYDSYGYKTPPMIARLMRSFRLQIPKCELGCNGRRFQYGNSECGMFSMYFIICMIHGISFKDFCKDAVNDGFMLQLRNIIFSK